MNTHEFRRPGHELVDWVADYRERMAALPVMSPVRPAEIRKRFPAAPPETGGRLEEAVQALDRDILPGITHWNHPAFFAYFPGNTPLSSVLADLVASGLGPQCMSWQTSPAATELEQVVMDWLRQMLGLSADFRGAIQDTASSATLVAMLCARERATAFGQERHGMQRETAGLCVYASDQAHSSVEKAILLAGFGRSHYRSIPTDGDHALRLDALDQTIAEDVRQGLRPCAVIATIGSTATTAIDPLAGIADRAKQHAMWLHVDAAMAGTAMVLPECRMLWGGIELADSIVLNPHKWMGAGFDFSAYFVRDPEHLVRVMSTSPSYLRTDHDQEVTNFRDWGIPLGRRFRALKLWFLLMDSGVEGIRTRLRRDLANAQWLREQVDGAERWDRLAPVPLQTVVMRHVPKVGVDESELTRHNLSIASHVNQSGRAYVTPSMLKGRQAIRVSIGAEAAEREHVEIVWRELRNAAAIVA